MFKVFAFLRESLILKQFQYQNAKPKNLSRILKKIRIIINYNFLNYKKIRQDSSDCTKIDLILQKKSTEISKREKNSIGILKNPNESIEKTKQPLKQELR